MLEDSGDNLKRRLIVLDDIEVIFALDIVIMKLTSTKSQLYIPTSLTRCTPCPRAYIRSRSRLRCRSGRKVCGSQMRGSPQCIRTRNNTLLWGSRHPLILRKPPIMQHNPLFPTHDGRSWRSREVTDKESKNKAWVSNMKSTKPHRKAVKRLTSL
jgi:hypothetical protein